MHAGEMSDRFLDSILKVGRQWDGYTVVGAGEDAASHFKCKVSAAVDYGEELDSVGELEDVHEAVFSVQVEARVREKCSVFRKNKRSGMREFR